MDKLTVRRPTVQNSFDAESLWCGPMAQPFTNGQIDCSFGPTQSFSELLSQCAELIWSYKPVTWPNHSRMDKLTVRPKADSFQIVYANVLNLFESNQTRMEKLTVRRSFATTSLWRSPIAKELYLIIENAQFMFSLNFRRIIEQNMTLFTAIHSLPNKLRVPISFILENHKIIL